MIIYYLYVKTHNKTGLQYLGYTSSVDPHKYTGSGKYWLLHLNKHGFDYSTRVLQKCVSKLAIKAWGLFYSKIWAVSESNKWANLMDESGGGGRQNKEVREKMSLTRTGRSGWKPSEQQKKLKSISMKGVKYSTQRCESMGKSKRKKVLIIGTVYSSRKEAALKLNIPESTVGFRIKSKSYPNWQYI